MALSSWCFGGLYLIERILVRVLFYSFVFVCFYFVFFGILFLSYGHYTECAKCGKYVNLERKFGLKIDDFMILEDKKVERKKRDKFEKPLIELHFWGSWHKEKIFFNQKERKNGLNFTFILVWNGKLGEKFVLVSPSETYKRAKKTNFCHIFCCRDFGTEKWFKNII